MKMYKLLMGMLTVLWSAGSDLIADKSPLISVLNCPQKENYLSLIKSTCHFNPNGATCVGSSPNAIFGSKVEFLLYFGEKGFVKNISDLQARLETLEFRGTALMYDNTGQLVEIRCLYWYHTPKKIGNLEISQNKNSPSNNKQGDAFDIPKNVINNKNVFDAPKSTVNNTNNGNINDPKKFPEVRLRTYAEVKVVNTANVLYAPNVPILTPSQFSQIKTITHGQGLSYTLHPSTKEISIPPGWTASMCQGNCYFNVVHK